MPWMRPNSSILWFNYNGDDRMADNDNSKDTGEGVPRFHPVRLLLLLGMGGAQGALVLVMVAAGIGLLQGEAPDFGRIGQFAGVGFIGGILWGARLV